MEALFLRPFCSVLGTALVTSCNALSIKCSTDDVVTATRQVTNSSASDKYNRVLLEIVADSGDIGRSLKAVCESYSGDLTERGVRLLRACGRNLCADASFLRRGLICGNLLKRVESLLQNRCLGLVLGLAASILDKLIKGWHIFPPSLTIPASGLFAITQSITFR